VVLLPGSARLCAGPDTQAADIARDITEHHARGKGAGRGDGSYQGLGEADRFKMEYREFSRRRSGGSSRRWPGTSALGDRRGGRESARVSARRCSGTAATSP